MLKVTLQLEIATVVGTPNQFVYRQTAQEIVPNCNIQLLQLRYCGHVRLQKDGAPACTSPRYLESHYVGYVIFYCRNLVAWHQQKPECPALSLMKQLQPTLFGWWREYMR